MSIYADTRGGTLIIDRRIRGVGRFKRSTGLPNTPKGQKRAKDYDQMLDRLKEWGRTDLVRAIAKRKLGWADAWEPYRAGNIDDLPSASHLVRLFPVDGKVKGAAGKWIPNAKTIKEKPVSDTHRADLRQSFLFLERIDKHATAGELPDLVRRLRVLCEADGTPRKFNKAKAHVQAFLRALDGKRRSHLWADVANLAGMEEARKDGHPQTPEQAHAVRVALGGPYGDIWWAMCCTGMGPGELWRDWYVDGDRVHILGTKRESRVRIVPLIGAPEKPLRGYKAFLEALEEADAALVPYDGRRTFAHWLEMAGVPRTRRRIYLGHKIGDVTDRYEGHDVTQYIPEDRARVRDYLKQKGVSA